jgi:hypothetical protein
MENDKNTNILYDSYNPIKLAEEIYQGLRKLLCDYSINGTIEKVSTLTKPEQQIFNNVSLMSEILVNKLKKEYKENR